MIDPRAVEEEVFEGPLPLTEETAAAPLLLDSELRARQAQALGEALQRVIAQTAFIRGPEVDQFEKEFAALVGVRHCISCANGTDARIQRESGCEPALWR